MPQLQRDPVARNSSVKVLQRIARSGTLPASRQVNRLTGGGLGASGQGSGASRILGPRFPLHLDEREGNDLAIR